MSGVLGGAYGLNGPPLVVYGNLRRWSAQHFRATLQAYFLVTSLVGAAGYAWRGLVTPVVLRDFALCLPAILPAVFLGRWLNRKLDGNGFFAWLYGGLFVIGALLVALTRWPPSRSNLPQRFTAGPATAEMKSRVLTVEYAPSW